MREFWPGRLGRELSVLRSGWRVGVSWSLRITVAAVAGYVVGKLLFPDTQPLVAALTAMLVVQVIRSRSWPAAWTGWWRW